jgi:hypothetical protein
MSESSNVNPFHSQPEPDPRYFLGKAESSLENGLAVHMGPILKDPTITLGHWQFSEDETGEARTVKAGEIQIPLSDLRPLINLLIGAEDRAYDLLREGGEALR